MKLTTANAVEYLCSRGHLAPGETANARQLTGGVSNAVIHVARSDGDDLVLKQVREQLSVAEPWFCSVDRIWREVEVLRNCENLIHGSTTDVPFKVEVPRLLFEDRQNYLYAMSAAPTEHIVWKDELLAGTARKEIARSCGTLLGTLHANSWHDDSLARQLDDRQFFDDLRLDPYYRQIARVHESLAPAIERLIDSVCGNRHCLVHGDFSPKNLLVGGNCLMLIDFEVGHYGDPAFDLGFFLSHLTLKAYYHAPMDGPFFNLIDSFWDGYCAEMKGVLSSNELDAVVQRGILNFAGCALARLDGKSRIDYLCDRARRDAMRELCRIIFTIQPQQWSDVRLLAGRLLTASQGPLCLPTKQSH
jgi:5-methylthioribose kinase